MRTIQRCVGLICLSCVGLVLAEPFEESAYAQEGSDRPRVLLIGDSISIGYTPQVIELLNNEAVVERMRDSTTGNNGQHTETGLARLNQWLGDTKWDVIHFNWGLWDLAYRTTDELGRLRSDKVSGTLTTPIERYESNLRELASRLKQTGATLIWASTTPVPEGEPGRFVGDERRYNEVAARVMAEHGVAIDDLYAAAVSRFAELQTAPDNVHFTRDGSAFLAQHVAASIRAALQRRKARPNVVLFLVDDMGWQDTSVPMWAQRTPFNDRYRAPHMERLAARGMTFTNAYASAPVCTPTRTSIMTGMSPGRSHITYWILNKDQDTSTKRDDIRAPEWNLNGLTSEDITLPKLLQSAGYRTIHVGKAHFGANDSSGSDPLNLGFDVNVAGHAAGGPASYYGADSFSVAGREGKDPASSRSVWDVPGLEKYHGRDIYLTEALAMEACDAVRQAVSDRKPFYLYFAPYAVHAPIMANRRYLEHFPDIDPREAAYATMIETMDAALGSVLDLLDELEVAKQTVVIFSSDNGGLSAHARGGRPHTHNAPLRSGKGSAYEGGTRVPTIINWPDVVQPGSRCDVPIISPDFFPTITSIAQVSIPESHRSRVDGRNISPLLKDQPGFDDSRPLFWHQPHQWGASGAGIWPFTSVRQDDWKLIYFHAGERFELFNLLDDIGETMDLSASHPDRVHELAEVMSRWIESANVQLSIDTATNQPVDMPRDAAIQRVGK